MADIIFPGDIPLNDLGVSNLPSNVDMVFWRGDAQTFVLNLTDSNGNPVPLGGYTAKASIKSGFSSTTEYDFVCTIGSPASAGQVTVYLSSAASSLIPAGTYIWDFKLVDATTHDQRTYLAGDVTVYDEVTH